jgi:hypothetical protein
LKSTSNFIIAMLFACIILPDKACAGIIITWDWNDGTTQGWQGSTTEANVANRLVVTNVRNGSLQIFSPNISNVDLRGLNAISFDLSIASYSTVVSPSDLTYAKLQLKTLSPMDPVPFVRTWDLDLSNLAFGQTRTFDLSIQNASGSGSLATIGFFDFIFAESSFTSNSSSAVLDNVIFSDAVPEPSILLLLGTGFTGLFAAHLSKRHARQL